MCKKGRIRLLSLDYASGYPEYRGEIRIEKEEKGYLLCNKLLLEEYLYSVVSSEMPATYPEEALNAQAVCARTYALYQRNKSYYSPYGANVDDTVNSQVYNNVAETKESKKAVKTTQEQYLEYKNLPVAAYFYSTSCGTTSDEADVWIGEGANPAYLKGHMQGTDQKEKNLSDEKKFQKFIREGGETGFEKGEAWYRWKGRISFEQLSDHFQKYLAKWLTDSPTSYLLQMDKKFAAKKKNL